MKSFLRALMRSFVELAKSEAGEFLSAREKARVLDVMLHQRQRAGPARRGSHPHPVQAVSAAGGQHRVLPSRKRVSRAPLPAR